MEFGSVFVDKDGGVHKSDRWHSAYGLPLVAYDVVSFDCVEGYVVEASEDVDLLGLGDGDG